MQSSMQFFISAFCFVKMTWLELDRWMFYIVILVKCYSKFLTQTTHKFAPPEVLFDF